MSNLSQREQVFVHYVASFLEKTFVMDRPEAEANGRNCLDYFRDLGADTKDIGVGGLENYLMRVYDAHYRWRDETQRATFLKEQEANAKSTAEAYNSFLDAQRPSPFKKW